MSGVPEMRSSSSRSLNCNDTISTVDDAWRSTITYDRDEVLRDDLVETGQECLDLILDRRVQAVVGRQLHELLLVLLRDRDNRAALLELHKLRHSELQKIECQLARIPDKMKNILRLLRR